MLALGSRTEKDRTVSSRAVRLRCRPTIDQLALAVALLRDQRGWTRRQTADRLKTVLGAGWVRWRKGIMECTQRGRWVREQIGSEAWREAAQTIVALQDAGRLSVEVPGPYVPI